MLRQINLFYHYDRVWDLWCFDVTVAVFIEILVVDKTFKPTQKKGQSTKVHLLRIKWRMPNYLQYNYALFLKLKNHEFVID